MTSAGNVSLNLSTDAAAARAEMFLRSQLPAAKSLAGRGIVICAGGVRYNSCAWVLIRMLRHLGCTLPIEVWYRGEEERDDDWIALVKPLGVRCIDALDVALRHPHPRLIGWELKPYAILHSAFEEVLFLDADNVPVREPSYLFDEPAYREQGAIFWPDPPHIRTPRDSVRWKVFGVPYRDEPEFESGQLAVNKSRCWEPLQLCNWYNEHSDFFYRFVYGDKDTFRFAWHKCGRPFAMTEYPVRELPHTLCQHDLQGRRLFQHRFNVKFSLFDNPRVPDFWHEPLCLEFLDELRRRWSPVRHLSRRATTADRERAAQLAGATGRWIADGFGHWPLELRSDGYVGRGGGWRRAFWWIESGSLVLASGDGRVACRLARGERGCWIGRGEREGRIGVRWLHEDDGRGFPIRERHANQIPAETIS